MVNVAATAGSKNTAGFAFADTAFYVRQERRK